MDEEEVGGLGALSALTGGGGGELPEDAKSYAMEILRDKSSRGATDKAFDSLESDAAAARSALQAARQRLLSRPAYDERDKYLAIAGAILGGGSTSGHFGEGLGRAASALGQERKAERQAISQRDSDEFSLDKELYGVDSSINSAKRSLMLKREELDTNLKGRALAALKTTNAKLTAAGQLPMSIKEWIEFQKMTPAQQARYLEMKRASNITNIAGVQSRVDPSGNVQPLTDIGTVAGNAATVAGAEAEATKTASLNAEQIAKAKETLPNAINAAKDLVDLIDRVATHPGLEGGVGLSADRITGLIPGSAVSDFAAANQQLNSNAFVSIIADAGSMVGLTNIEGEKLQTAKVNLDRAQSPKQYREALARFKAQSERSLKLLQEKLQRAQAPRQAGPAGAPPPASPGEAAATPGAPKPPVRKYNPKTGKIE